MKLLVFVAGLLMSVLANAQTAFFTIWPGHPDFSPLPPSSVTGVEVEYPIAVNVRTLVADNASRAGYSLQLGDGSNLVFAQQRFVPIQGFIGLGQTDIQPDPEVPDSDLGYYWYGTSQNSSFIFSVHQGRLSGTIITAEKHFALTESRGQLVLRRFNPDLVPTDLESGGTPLTEQDILTARSTPLATKFFDPINVLVLHTPAALTAAGSQAQLNATIAEMFAQSEVTIQNSGITSFRLQNALTAGNLSTQINYPETNNPPVGCLFGPGPCRWIGHRIFVRTDATVQSLRNTNAADLVVMLVADQADASGVAYTQRPNCGIDPNAGETVPGCTVGAGYNNFAVAVVSYAFATSFQVFAHETGHQLGMEHNTENGSAAPSFAWSYGHYVQGQNETIMSVANAGGLCSVCPRAFHYSSPNINFTNSAAPSGTPLRWNARTGAALAPHVSEFRNPVLGTLIFRSAFESLPVP
jgi:hypothetical protein